MMSSYPQRLDKYELRERLGQGGMAEVWKAFDTQLQRYVAIKLLHANLRDDPNFVTRFRREAQLIASLHHPNIVQIHDFQVAQSPTGQGNDTMPIAYMVMDYVEGQTLATYIHTTSARGNIPSPADILRLFTSISLAIDYAHQHGMIHRDIKPSNILLDGRNTTLNPMGEPILTDFGVAKLMSSSSNTQSGALLGTPLYISPEQARGYPGNERSDIYSLGIILYEIITGVTPFRGANPLDVMNQHINSMPPSPVLINPRIPPALTLVIMRGLAKNPAERFPSASSLTIALAEAFNLPVPEVLSQPGYPTTPLEMPTAVQTFASSPSTQLAPPSVPPTPVLTVQSGQSHVTPILTPAALSAINAIPAQAGTMPPQTTPMPPGNKRDRRRTWYIALAVALIVVLLGSSLATYFIFFQHLFTPTPIIGNAFFVSSGQVNPDTTQGIADQIKVVLHNVPPPAAGKSYHLWLLGDINPPSSPDLLGTPPIQLPMLLTATLPVQHDTVNYLYLGDTNHDNLFSAGSRLLITEESSSAVSSPSTNRSTWRYYAALPQAPIPLDANHFSAVTHIRHLFYNETGIKVLGLPGGLDTWFTRNTEKLLEWSISARDDWHGASTTPTDSSLMHDQFIRMLDYLDGSPNVHIDTATGTPILADPTFSKVALLTVDPQNQGQPQFDAINPPGYVDHIQLHVSQVSKAIDITPQERVLTASILDAVNNAKTWLMQARQDDIQLHNMNNTQLMQPASGAILDDLVTQITYAYMGQLDPLNNQVHPGVLQMHYDIQQLATFTFTTDIPQTI